MSVYCRVAFLRATLIPQGAETVYAQFDIWKANAAWSESTDFAGDGRRGSVAYPEEDQLMGSDPPPYPVYGRGYSGASGGHSQQQDSSYGDMAFVLQVCILTFFLLGGTKTLNSRFFEPEEF